MDYNCDSSRLGYIQKELFRLSSEICCNKPIITSTTDLTGQPASALIGIDTTTGVFYYNNAGVWAPETGTENLQQVTNLGDITTNPITIGNVLNIKNSTSGNTSTINSANITVNRNLLVPDSNGTIVTRINNVSPDTTGNVTISIGGSILTPLVAYVSTLGNDSTGIVGDESKPFLTIDAALISTSPNAVIIKIGLGTFNSPSTDNIRSNISFIGSGQPDVNNITTTSSHDGEISNTTPTALFGGTILNNTFSVPWDSNYVIIKDLGIDVGSDWCNNFNSGTAVNALIIAQQYQNVISSGGTLSADGVHRLQDILRIGINVENVTCLCKSASDLVHAALFENCYENHVINLKTYYGFAGVVIKTIGGIYTNISANGHESYGIVFKDNDYSRCRSNALTNFTIRSIQTFDGMGLSLSSGVDIGSGTVLFCSIANGVIEGCTYGIHSDGNYLQATTNGCNLTNIVIFRSQNQGVLVNCAYTKFSGILSWLSGNTGIDITNLIGANNTVSNCQSLASTGDGVHLTGNNYSTVTFDNLVSTDNSGTGLVVSGNVNGIGLTCKNNVISNEISGNLIPIGVNTAQPLATLHIKGDSTNPTLIVNGPNNPNGILNVEDLTNQIQFFNSYKFPTSHGTVGQTLVDDGSGNLNFDFSSEPHIIFSPTTGSSITILPNQKNIINSAPLAALVFALPSSPVDNTIIDVKFANNITAITYTGGTVIGNTTGIGGTTMTLTYDLTTTTWY